MARDLTRIGERARQDPRARFTSIYHYVTDLDHLRACYAALPADRAAGVDGVGKEEYGRNLEVNLAELSAKLGRLGIGRNQSSVSIFGNQARTSNDRWASYALRTSWWRWHWCGC